MRLAIAISVLAANAVLSGIHPDEPFIKIAVGSHGGYIIPQSYAEDHRVEVVSSIPGEVTIDGFWTPPEQDVLVADRVFRDAIHDAVKDPTLFFPDLAPSADGTVPASPELEEERTKLTLVSQNYESYERQYVGIIVDGTKLVLCNYSNGTEADPSTDYICMQKFFASGGKTHFLQCRVDVQAKTCANVSMIGSWPGEK